MYPQTRKQPTTAVTYKFKISDATIPTQYRLENRTPYVAYIAIGAYDNPVDVVANAIITCMGLNTVGFTVSGAQQARSQTLTVWLSNLAVSAVFPETIETFISLVTLTSQENVFESPSAGLLSSINPATFDRPTGYPVTYAAGTVDSDSPAIDLQGWNGAYIGLQTADSGNTLYPATFGIEVHISEDALTWGVLRQYAGNATTLIVPRVARYVRIRRKGNTHALTIRARRYQNDPGIAETLNPVFSTELPTTLGNPTVIFAFPKGNYRLYALSAYSTNITLSSGFMAGGVLALTAGVWNSIDISSSYDGLHRFDLSAVFTGALNIVAVPVEPAIFRPLSAAPANRQRFFQYGGAYVATSTFLLSATQGMTRFQLTVHIQALTITSAFLASPSGGPLVAEEGTTSTSWAETLFNAIAAGSFWKLSRTYAMGNNGAIEAARISFNAGSTGNIYIGVTDLSEYTPVWTTQG